MRTPTEEAKGLPGCWCAIWRVFRGALSRMMAPPSARSGRASAECSDGEGGHSHSAPTSTVGARTLAAVKARAASAQQRLGDLRTTIHGRLAALERQNAEQSAALDAAATERAELHALLLEERAASAATKAARAREQEEMEKKIEKKTSALTAAERDRAELEAALAESLAAHKTHAAIHVEADARQQRLESELIAIRLILKNELRVSDASLGVARAGAEFAERDRQRGEEARGKSGKNGGEGGDKGGGWIGGGLESSSAPWMAGRHAVTRPPSP